MFNVQFDIWKSFWYTEVSIVLKSRAYGYGAYGYGYLTVKYKQVSLKITDFWEST